MNINLQSISPFVNQQELVKWQEKALKALAELEGRGGKGNDFLGWINLPSSITSDEIKALQATAKNLSKGIEIVVVIGIGGSYLGAKAVIDALSHSFSALLPARKHPIVVFAGQNISEDYHAELLEILQEKSAACIIISKSGTTTEPAIAFRLIKQHFEEKYGKAEAKNRIVAITDVARGALRTLAVQKGYQTFVIPDDVGGRFSVLTPVGLLSIAVAGFDIEALIKGAVEMEQRTSKHEMSNPATQYAAVRNALYYGGKKIEVLVNYNPKLHFITEWWKQLYGESEGKEYKGIFPAGVDFTSDLHSMGQYLQEGERILFETVLSVKQEQHTLIIPKDEQNFDQLNFLSGRRLSECNKMAELGTLLAHVDGGVPNIHIEIPAINEHNLGALLYFFEKACGISGYMLGVNP
ncbi:MAG: glucose-6-phosphate isomerase, partial [Prevotellaceae bacterium]|nr:glucose-6-phosphate isomerase [Prevotellaceae bacterium]